VYEVVRRFLYIREVGDEVIRLSCAHLVPGISSLPRHRTPSQSNKKESIPLNHDEKQASSMATSGVFRKPVHDAVDKLRANVLHRAIVLVDNIGVEKIYMFWILNVFQGNSSFLENSPKAESRKC
jgi:hypothetical protein